MLAFGFGAIDPVDATTLPVDVFDVRDPVFVTAVAPVPDGSFTPPLWVRAPESVIPVQDTVHERENDHEEVFVIPVPTTNPVPVDPVKLTDHVLFNYYRSRYFQLIPCLRSLSQRKYFSVDL